MSPFREWFEALDRMMRRRPASSPPVSCGHESEPDDPLRRPALLPWRRAVLAPLTGHTEPDVRRKVAGELYGREFTVWFPPADTTPPGHLWVLATWDADHSGTHRPEAMGICRTCTMAHDRVVAPARCVLLYRAAIAPRWDELDELED